MAYTRKHRSRKHHGKKGGMSCGSEKRGGMSCKKGGMSCKKGGNPKKGQKSRTMKGKRDFTTKKGNKYFNRKGHRQSRAQGSKKHRRPFRKHRGGGILYPPV